MSDYQGTVVALLGTATAVMGWLYARRTGLEQTRKDLVATMTQRMNESDRLNKLRLDDLEERLRACEARWRKWSGGPVG